jgi:hypothetical protein
MRSRYARFLCRANPPGLCRALRLGYRNWAQEKLTSGHLLKVCCRWLQVRKLRDVELLHVASVRRRGTAASVIVT